MTRARSHKTFKTYAPWKGNGPLSSEVHTAGSDRSQGGHSDIPLTFHFTWRRMRGVRSFPTIIHATVQDDTLKQAPEQTTKGGLPGSGVEGEKLDVPDSILTSGSDRPQAKRKRVGSECGRESDGTEGDIENAKRQR